VPGVWDARHIRGGIEAPPPARPHEASDEREGIVDWVSVASYRPHERDRERSVRSTLSHPGEALKWRGWYSAIVFLKPQDVRALFEAQGGVSERLPVA
jgi:hypothetical protein